MIVKCIGLGAYIGGISTVAAISNAIGRIFFSAVSDKLSDRKIIFTIILLVSVLTTWLTLFTQGIAKGWDSLVLSSIVLFLIFVINAGYGGGFSCIPTLLSDHYGMGNISAIHGITLSAWAFAGLTGNQLATFIVSHTGQFVNVAGFSVNPTGYQNVVLITSILYFIAMLLSQFLVKSRSRS